MKIWETYVLWLRVRNEDMGDARALAESKE